MGTNAPPVLEGPLGPPPPIAAELLFSAAELFSFVVSLDVFYEGTLLQPSCGGPSSSEAGASPP
jgi:hypothetical protein